MGIRIESVGVSTGNDTHSAVEHGGRAARKSLELAGIRPDQVGVLINAGIFRDSNTVEPAVSALIQRAAGIGLEYAKDDPRTFSFDLMNGATGVLNAVQVAASILETGSAEHVLVVSGDTHPSLTRFAAADDFPYRTAGSALLLARTDEPEGFGRVHTVAGEGTPAVQAYVDTATMGPIGRGLMTVEREPDFAQRLLDVAVRAARGVLIDTDGVALIASTPTAEFPLRLAESLGIEADSVFTPDLTYGDPHTAALPLAYARALAGGGFGTHTQVLFVAAGAGPAAAASLYRLPALVGAPA
ncbi:hypothetical protein [Nocardia arthritidis]|uniref:Beta-ketoacyl-[acyl-carrier-protein] synthase III N-terminal domain-containing protein n=1 Tax=Nocardia arthritidis TaxID=228602 RepID=A0A6G9YJM5_9NOCA|nr:hypothetical protein [Nocardia arthritidis]QIS13267.1 hypothetical protein F5544_27065 [Nocardia arthritidis]